VEIDGGRLITRRQNEIYAEGAIQVSSNQGIISSSQLPQDLVIRAEGVGDNSLIQQRRPFFGAIYVRHNALAMRGWISSDPDDPTTQTSQFYGAAVSGGELWVVSADPTSSPSPRNVAFHYDTALTNLSLSGAATSVGGSTGNGADPYAVLAWQVVPAQ
jgi:hypothetical protein